jgi:hypothetical protein
MNNATAVFITALAMSRVPTNATARLITNLALFLMGCRLRSSRIESPQAGISFFGLCG